MRSSFGVNTGLKLARTPSARAYALRRRFLILAALLALAAGGAVIGAVTAPRETPGAAPSPFSYFPSE